MNDLPFRLLALLHAISPKSRPTGDDSLLFAEQIRQALASMPTGYRSGTWLTSPHEAGAAGRLQIDLHGVGKSFTHLSHQFCPIEFSPVDTPSIRLSCEGYGAGNRLADFHTFISEGLRRFDAVIVPLQVPVNPPYTRTVYFIESLTPVTNALLMARDQGSETTAVASTLSEYRQLIADAFSVRGLVTNHRLAAALDALVLQSLSMTKHPIHICSMSAPGTAKGLLQAIARGIAPCYLTAGAKYSMAGLVGSMRTLKDGTQFSDPGYLKRADGGVLGLEDIHNLFVGRHEPLVHVLANCMEGGVISDSTRNRVEYLASTSILADANPSSTVGILGQEMRVPGNLLTRFAAIFHFDSGFEEVLQTAKDMLNPKRKDAGTIRSIRLALATQRAKRADAPLWTDSAATAAQTILDLITKDLDHVDRSLLQIYLTRTSNGIMALAIAHAVLRQSETAEAQDVDAVAHIVMIKFQSLSELLAHREATIENGVAKQGRLDAICDHFSGQTVPFQDVQQFYRLSGWEVTRQTVHRDLRDLEQAGKVARAWGKSAFPAGERLPGEAM